MHHDMSKLRAKKESPTCACQNTLSTGKFSLRLEPRTTDVRDKPQHDEILQMQQSEALQSLFLPQMSSVPVHQHGTGFHVHPDAPAKVAHIDQLHDLLDKHDLVARVHVAPSMDDTAVAVALTRAHVSDLVSTGVVDLHVPIHGSTVRLHSTRPGRITAAEFLK